MKSLLDAALEYASFGWHVFPCRPDSKAPLTTHGVYDATTNPALLHEWWQRWPNANVAVACGEKSGISVVDIDGNVDEWLAKLPGSTLQQTPRGGYHVFYKYNRRVRNSVRLHDSLDTRSDGGYVLVAPSKTTDGLYQWGSARSELEEFPEWLIPVENSASEQTNIATTSTEQPTDCIARASAYLAACDPAIQGLQGHNKLLYAADRLINGFLLTDQQAYDLLATEFNPRCIPPWDLTEQKDEKDFRRKIVEARKLGKTKAPGWLLQTAGQDSSGISDFVTRVGSANRRTIRPHSGVSGGLPEIREAGGRTIWDERRFHTPPGLLGEICQWMNETALIQQPLLSLGASITFLGALLGRKVQDSLGSRTNLYCMGVAPSSAGKNHAITCIRNLCAEALCTQVLGGEYVASDAAIEERMAKAPTTLFLWDEIGYLLSHIRSGVSKNHAQVISMLMKLYSSASSMYLGREYADKDRQRVIIQPCCCIYGTATPESFACGLSPDQLQDGWLSRCLVFYSQDRPSKRRHAASSKVVPAGLVERVKQLYEWRPEWPNESAIRQYVAPDRDGSYQERPPYQWTVPETEEASKIFTEFDNETVERGNQDVHLACLWKKGEENARRIALILACGDGDGGNITAEHAIYATNLIRYLLDLFIEHIVPEISENETARRKQKIMRLLQTGPNDGLPIKELTRYTRWIMGPDRARLLDDLVAAGEIETTLVNSEILVRRVQRQ